MKICSVIVTYNRIEELVKCVDANLAQTAKPYIMIVDNASTDNTQGIVSEKYDSNDRVIYCRLDNNIGGAGGFNFGMIAAFERGFDYVWMMDDDGRPLKEDSLGRIIEKLSFIIPKDIIINSLVTNGADELSFGLSNCSTVKDAYFHSNRYRMIENQINPFNGTFISRATYEKIGAPKIEYFIKGDEMEYFYRAKKNNVYIATDVDSLFFHPQLCEGRFIEVFGRKYPFSEEAWWKEFYRARNTCLNLMKYGSKKDVFFWKCTCLYKCLLFKDDRGRKTKYVIKGLRQAKTGRIRNLQL